MLKLCHLLNLCVFRYKDEVIGNDDRFKNSILLFKKLNL